MTMRDQIDDNGVMPLPGLGPAPGDRYVNRHRLIYATVVAVLERRRCWVLIRVRDGEKEIPLDELNRYWRPV